jgi:hypothetical protein
VQKVFTVNSDTRAFSTIFGLFSDQLNGTCLALPGSSPCSVFN